MLNSNDPNRTPGGQFRPGHGIKSPGRPPAVMERDYNNAVTRGASDADVEAVMIKMVEKAKAGDPRAAEIVLDRTAGKPVQIIDIRADEVQIVKRLREAAAIKGMTFVEFGNMVLDIMSPEQIDDGRD